MHPVSLERVLASSNLILFFSLPFRPAARRNAFYNGHSAVCLDGQVYQVYNPKLLKSNFLFSVMPVADWLFGKGGKWVERDPSSPHYRHVYLYKTCESTRTAVYAAGVTADAKTVDAIRSSFTEQDERFRTGAYAYDFVRNNCSSIIADGLAHCGMLRPGPQNLIPSMLFKRFAANPDLTRMVRIGKVAAYDTGRFGLHRFCIGLWGLDPEKSMDRWVEEKATSSFKERFFQNINRKPIADEKC